MLARDPAVRVDDGVLCGVDGADLLCLLSWLFLVLVLVWMLSAGHSCCGWYSH